ncbi:Per1-like protein [Thamnidium elegans]|nr:Per1-like protein [Thamnidium elegans]
MSKLNWFIILLFIHICFGSTGNDQAPFQHCLDECVQVSCPTASLNFWLRLFNWNCPEDCRYVCSQQMTDTAQEQGLEIYQYYGKWPFYRLLGMQEPASVFFSIGNGLVHLYYFTRLRKKVPTVYDLKGYMLLYSCIGINTWFWSTVFHMRDTYWTQLLDYFGATLLVLYSLFYAIIRVFHLLKLTRRCLGLLFFCCYLTHIVYLSVVSFDFTYNMIANVIVGSIQVSVWFYWFIIQKGRSYAYLAVISCIGISLSVCLELIDFPPLWRVFDTHSLWHLTTIPLTIIWYKFLLADMWYETHHELLP